MDEENYHAAKIIIDVWVNEYGTLAVRQGNIGSLSYHSEGKHRRMIRQAAKDFGENTTPEY